MKIDNPSNDCYSGEVMLSVHDNYIHMARYGFTPPKQFRIVLKTFNDQLPEGCGDGPFHGMKGTMLNKDELIQIRDGINDFIDSFE